MKRNVLIIDDDQLFCRTLKYELQDDTTSVYYTESVQESMLCLTQNDYALIIMDTRLTGSDGISVLGVIRQIKLAVPIMILTSNDSLTEQLRALEIGADVVLEKKADPLEYVIGHARAIWARSGIQTKSMWYANRKKESIIAENQQKLTQFLPNLLPLKLPNSSGILQYVAAILWK